QRLLIFAAWSQSHAPDRRSHLRKRRPQAHPAVAVEGPGEGFRHDPPCAEPGTADGRDDPLDGRCGNARAHRSGPRLWHPGVPMTFDDLQSGDTVFLDANTLIYHFTNHPSYGGACTQLVERIENQELQGITLSHCLADGAHRLMTIEAMGRLGWPPTRLA